MSVGALYPGSKKICNPVASLARGRWSYGAPTLLAEYDGRSLPAKKMPEALELVEEEPGALCPGITNMWLGSVTSACQRW